MEIFFNEVVKLDLPPIYGGGYHLPRRSLFECTEFVLTEIEFRGIGFHDYLSKLATICCTLIKWLWKIS
jgi:hypothetical protein